MKADKLYMYLDKGATLIVNAVGVTFESSRYPGTNKQSNIDLMQEGVEQNDDEVELIHDKNNKYDDNGCALEIIYEGYDLGFIPAKITTVGLVTSTRKYRSVTVEGLNKMLLEYKKPLSCVIGKIWGGYDNKHKGFNIEISAVL